MQIVVLTTDKRTLDEYTIQQDMIDIPTQSECTESL